MLLELVCATAMQQLTVRPYPVTVGDPVTVRAAVDGQPIAGLAVAVEDPAGLRRELGPTDADGEVRAEVAVPGLHRFDAEHRGVRLVAPLPVLPERRRWLWALVCVPLGLALLWRIWRRPDAATSG